VAQLQRLAIAPHQSNGQHIVLTPEQRHYLGHVLRLRSGDRFIAILAQGQGWLAELGVTSSDAQLIESIAMTPELVRPVTLCAAVTKGQGFDDVVRAVTELGVTTLVPLVSARTMVNPGLQKLERWQRIATEAAEQSYRAVVPEIYPPLTFEQGLALHQGKAQQGFIGVTGSDGLNLWHALEKVPQVGILMMVGPEGGWTVAEQAQAIAQGFQPVSLGNRILRSVTAAIAVMAILAARIDASQSQN
jgi:16S rRNA (uracil1498-N3)-methyltransferase